MHFAASSQHHSCVADKDEEKGERDEEKAASTGTEKEAEESAEISTDPVGEAQELSEAEVGDNRMHTHTQHSQNVSTVCSGFMSTIHTLIHTVYVKVASAPSTVQVTEYVRTEDRETQTSAGRATLKLLQAGRAPSNEKDTSPSEAVAEVSEAGRGAEVTTSEMRNSQSSLAAGAASQRLHGFTGNICNV